MPEQQSGQQSGKLTLTWKKPLSLEEGTKGCQQTKQGSSNKPLNPKRLDAEERQKIHQDRKEEEQQKSREKFKQSLGWLLSSFPHCFNLKNPLPLKRQIEFDIFAHLPNDGSMSKKSLRTVIGYYTQRTPYYNVILASKHRFDLQGNPVEEIAEHQKEHAATRLAWKKDRENKSPKESTNLGDNPANKCAA